MKKGAYDVQRVPRTISPSNGHIVSRRLMVILPPKLSPVHPYVEGATTWTMSSFEGGLLTGGSVNPMVTPDSLSCVHHEHDNGSISVTDILLNIPGSKYC